MIESLYNVHLFGSHLFFSMGTFVKSKKSAGGKGPMPILKNLRISLNCSNLTRLCLSASLLSTTFPSPFSSIAGFDEEVERARAEFVS